MVKSSADLTVDEAANNLAHLGAEGSMCSYMLTRYGHGGEMLFSMTEGGEVDGVAAVWTMDKYPVVELLYCADPENELSLLYEAAANYADRGYEKIYFDCSQENMRMCYVLVNYGWYFAKHGHGKVRMCKRFR